MPKNSFTQTDRTHNLCSAGSVIAIQRSSFILNVNFIIVQLLFIIAYTTHRCSGTWTKKISLSSVLFYLIFDGLMLFSLLSYIYIYIPFNGQECMLSYSLRLPFYRLNFFYRLLLFYRLFYIFLILFRKVEWLKSGIASWTYLCSVAV